MNSYEYDWAAIATFLAVIVALFPIWESKSNKRRISFNLRTRALAKLHLLDAGLDRMSKAGPTLAKMSNEEIKAIYTLESIASNPDGLKPLEQEILILLLEKLENLNTFIQSRETDKIDELIIESRKILKTLTESLYFFRDIHGYYRYLRD